MRRARPNTIHLAIATPYTHDSCQQKGSQVYVFLFGRVDRVATQPLGNISIPSVSAAQLMPNHVPSLDSVVWEWHHGSSPCPCFMPGTCIPLHTHLSARQGLNLGTSMPREGVCMRVIGAWVRSSTFFPRR